MMKMNIHEIIALFTGAAISLFSSIVTLWVTNVINRTGRIRIFYKFVGLKDYISGWGFFGSEDGGMQLVIPTIFEIQNTKNTPFVMRDVNLALFNDKRIVSEMIQITDEARHGVNCTEYGLDKGSYSFVIEPHSIKRIRCLYILRINQNEKEEKKFEYIKMVYYNENNHRIEKRIKTICGDWNCKNFGTEIKWSLVK